MMRHPGKSRDGADIQVEEEPDESGKHLGSAYEDKTGKNSTPKFYVNSVSKQTKSDPNKKPKPQ